ncbi:unnamed protein product [Brachionus calyciflorus]|uniref:H15 domain-containing protein n=1 Tax=Brachionus calyciflorus TaxID=104777 RepID=A0A813MHA5_9BILA|nr:unnamed protein product [Brachionus calyciflorus]
MAESEAQQRVVKTRGRKKIEKAVPKQVAQKRGKKKAPTRSHPKFIDMVTECLEKLDEKSGLSRQAILKYIVSNFSVDEKNSNQYLKVALKNGVKSGHLKQLKGIGASGSFKLAEKAPTKSTKSKKALKVTVNKTTNLKKTEKKTTKKELVGKKTTTVVVKRGRKPKTVTKEAAQSQTPSSTPKSRKPPAVREQVNIKKARGSKSLVTEAAPLVSSQVEQTPTENPINQEQVEPKIETPKPEENVTENLKV